MKTHSLLLSLLVSLILGGCGTPADSSDVLRDEDGDGVTDDYDCAAEDPDIFPGATDPVGDGIDQNCDGADGVDADGDGWVPPEDCNDSDRSVHLNAEEICGNGMDDDCDGLVDEYCGGDDDSGR